MRCRSQSQFFATLKDKAMRTRNIIDIAFILLAFGIYIIILNTDACMDGNSILCRYFWILLVISYYIGRGVSRLKRKAE